MTAIIILAVLCYLAWTVTKTNAKYFAYAACSLHAIVCFYSLFDENGWKLDILNAVLLVSWLSVLIVLVFKISNQWVKIPLVIFTLVTLVMNNSESVLKYHHYKEFSWQLDLHISLSMLAYSILSVASLFAVSLYIHIFNLKNNKFEAGNSLNSIIAEEKKLFYLIFLGWLILSTSLLSGAIFIENFMDQHLGHKVIFSMSAWLVFGMIILGRIVKGWRGEKLILLTIIGMVLLATGYMGSKIVLEWII